MYLDEKYRNSVVQTYARARAHTHTHTHTHTSQTCRSMTKKQPSMWAVKTMTKMDLHVGVWAWVCEQRVPYPKLKNKEQKNLKQYIEAHFMMPMALVRASEPPPARWASVTRLTSRSAVTSRTIRTSFSGRNTYTKAHHSLTHSLTHSFTHPLTAPPLSVLEHARTTFWQSQMPAHFPTKRQNFRNE